MGLDLGAPERRHVGTQALALFPMGDGIVVASSVEALEPEHVASGGKIALNHDVVWMALTEGFPPSNGGIVLTGHSEGKSEVKVQVRLTARPAARPPGERRARPRQSARRAWRTPRRKRAGVQSGW